MLQGAGHLGELIANANPSTDPEFLARKARNQKQYEENKKSLDHIATLGLSKNLIEGGVNNRLIDGIGGLAEIAPAILAAESTGGGSFYLQGVGGAAQHVDQLKANGVKFNNHADELYIQGAGIINYLLGKSVASTVLGKMGTGFENDVVGNLSAAATKKLADLGAKATAEDVANVYAGTALTFVQKLKQMGMSALKSYPKIASEFAAANLANTGVKALSNKLNGGGEPFGQVTGDEVAQDIISPIYNGGTPNGNVADFVKGLVMSPAAGLSMLHLATSSGMLLDKSPMKNAVIESLQKDTSPENVQAVKEQITKQGLRSGWTDDEISNTHTAVDALADIASKLPTDIAPQKFHDATNLVLGRRQLEAVLKETQDKKGNLDPAIAGKAAPFEALLKAKIEQANDKLDELITDKSYTYTEDGGKYYKSKLGEDPIEISKDRFDLEEVENSTRPKEEKTKVIKEPAEGKPSTAEKQSAEKPAATPATEPANTPDTASSMLDDLDKELDNFKQPTAEPQAETPATPAPTTSKPDVGSNISTFEPNQTVEDQHTGETYKIVSQDKNGMAVLENTETGEQTDINAFNNPRFKLYEKENRKDTSATIEKSDATSASPAKKNTTPANEKPAGVAKPKKGEETPGQIEAKTYVNSDVEPIKAGTANVLMRHHNKDGSSIVVVVAKSVHGDNIASVKTKDANGKVIPNAPGSGWRIPAKAIDDFDEYTKGLDNELLPKLGDNVELNKKPYRVTHELTEGSEAKYQLTDADGKTIWTNEQAFISGNPMAEVVSTSNRSPKSKYYTAFKNDGLYEYEETDGKPLANEHGLDLFVHDRGDDFAVSEGSTGLKIADGATEAEAIANARKLLTMKRPEDMQALIDAKRDAGLVSPRGIVAQKPVVSAKNITAEEVNELNEILKTEGVTVKDIEEYEQLKRSSDSEVQPNVGDNATDVSKSENDTEASPVKNSERESVQGLQPQPEIDNIKLKSKYDSVGDTEKDMRETGSRTPSKRFNADLTKYSKALAKKLGYEHDTVNTGAKHPKKKDENIIISPGHNYSSLILWKPDSDYGVYISINTDPDMGNGIGEDSLTVNTQLLWRVTRKDDKYSGFGNRYAKSNISVGELSKEIERAVNAEESNRANADKKRKTSNPTSEHEPANEAPKDEPQAKTKREQFEQELKDAKEAFKKTFNKALLGINPETIEKGIKLMAVYAKIGIHDFKEIVRDLATDMGESLRDVFEGLKASYGAFASQEATDAQLDLMTDIREVRKITIDEFLSKKQSNDTGSKSNTLDENTSAVDAGQSARGTDETVQQQGTEKVPGRQNDGSGNAGDAVEKKQPQSNRNRQSDSGSGVSTGEPGTERGLTADDNRSAATEDTPKRTIAPADQNHVIKPNDVIVPTGVVGKFTANVNAMFLLKKLESENRNPTPQEKAELAKFVGWGGLAKYLDAPDYQDNQAIEAVINGKRANFLNKNYTRTILDFTDNGPLDLSKYDTFDSMVNDVKKMLSNSGYAISPDALRGPLLKQLLSPEEYQSARNSTVNAYYTDKAIIKGMWDIASQLGIKGGRVVESSAGIGHFFGLIPQELRDKLLLQGYELDSVSGRILKKLYPQAAITIGGFENARIPQNSLDFAIGNVPFATSAPYDKNFPELSKFSMHNYFIAKNLKLLKPGGIGMMITSASTMDSPSSAKFREWVTAPDGGNSYLVGAIRLPSNAFSENAGTQVTTDILIFQKKGQVVDSSLEQPFRYSKYLKTGEDDKGQTVDINVNEYYIEHPEQMLGEMKTAHEAGIGGLYGGDNATLQAPDNFDMSKALNKAKELLPSDIAGNKTELPKIEEAVIAADDKKNGSIFEKAGKIYKVTEGDAVPLKLDAKQSAIAKAYTDIKGSLLNLIKLEQSNVNAQDNIEAQRKELNKEYDAFVKKHGFINSKSTSFLNDEDIDFPIVASLENIARSIQNVGGKDRIVQDVTKGEILSKRINYPRTEPTKATDIKDAINISLNYRNGLDVTYMAKMLGEDVETLKDKLIDNDLAYENPDTGILETPDEYLSGYVREKLRKAEIAANTDSRYEKNVTELKKVIPADIPSSLISYSLGSAWIPASVYEQFVSKTFDARIAVKYLPNAGKFIVDTKMGKYNAQAINSYAAGGMNGLDILESTLNNVQIVISDTFIDGDGKKRSVKNPEKTAAAQAMQQQLQDEFVSFVDQDEKIQNITERLYNDTFNGQVLRTYRAPDFKHYPGASTVIDLRHHQKIGVSRGLSESTLLAHEVGSGKTFTIITTAMEMRRLGTARKPLIGVQNSTLGDFVADFRKLYPGAKILAPTEKEMEAEGRKRLFAKMATGDWDAIILPHSQISMIPDDPERQKAYIMEQIQELNETISTVDDRRERGKLETEVKALLKEYEALDMGDDSETKKGGRSVAKKIGEKALKIEASMAKAFDRKVDNILNFEQLGIDAMLMDEAHKYKRLGFQTSMKNIKGIDTSKSQRSQSVLLKARWIQEKTGGKNVNFYTGTPISNTMAEAWTMIKYLRPDILQKMGIEYFDQFAKTFGQVIPSLEQTGGGTFKVQNRFAKFQNLPEFITAFRATADVVLTEDVKEFQNTDTIPKLKNGKFTQVIIPQSEQLKQQIQEFRRTLEWFDRLSGAEKRKNSHVPLVVFNKAKQASIDLRLLDPENIDSPQSKVNQAIDRAFDIYKANKDKKGVQMIFSDMYQSPEPKDRYLDEDGLIVNPSFGKNRFNLFEDIKKKLVARGVPADEIVIFTEPKYDKAERKKAVFADANSGKIRFLLGTTEKMGVGVNAQKKLVALHHLDAPARPMDFEQRNGRIIRQGNENKEVDVLTYGVEKTLDSSAFQRLATKQKFINQIMKGQNLERVTEDPADEAQMTFDEMMAHLSDSPFAMQKLLVDNKVRSEMMKQQNFNAKKIRTNRLMRDTENELRQDNLVLDNQIKAAQLVRDNMPDGVTVLKVGNEEHTEKLTEAADDYINKLINKFHDSPTRHAKGVILVNNVRAELEITNDQHISKKTNLVVDNPVLSYTMPEIGMVGSSYTKPGYVIGSNSGVGLLASIRSKVKEALVLPADTQARINRLEKDIEQYKKDSKSTFDDSALKSLTAESEALKEKMLKDGNKNPNPDDDGGGPNNGAQTPAEYIKDQSNIQPALNFLDGMKAKNDGKFLSSIVPIPPAVWNGAIDVMKNILKATNSTQKAIRVAAKYIVDRGGSEAQAKDFESTMSLKMAETQYGKKATVADSDEALTEDIAIKAAGEIQSKLKGMDISPDEKAFAKMDVSVLTKKELHRYIEVASVLSVDPQGVLSSEVSDFMDRVANRLNPKGGTAVPPEPPTTPPGDNGSLFDDEEPRRRIPKKDKLPMDSMGDLNPQTDEAGKPIAKENYSAMGRLKDIRVRNLEQLKDFGKDTGDMSALRDVRQYATSKSQSSIVMKTATDKIVKTVGKDGWNLLRQALIESRLRGIKQRWENWAAQIKKTSDNDIDDLFIDGQQSLMYDVVSRLDGYEDDPAPGKTILGMLSNDQYDDAREYLSEIFANAGENVAFYDKLANGQTFDEMVVDGKFTDPKMQEALDSYKSLMAKPFEESHAANEGIFSDALGPLDTYYPLVPKGADKHVVVTAGAKYKAPDNPNNKFATGQGNEYSTALSDLSYKLANAIRTSNKANAIRSLESAGLIAKVTKDAPDGGYIKVNDEIYTAKKVLVQDAKLIVGGGKTVTVPARYVLMPNWLYKEVKPIFEDDGSLRDDFSLFGRINNLGIKLMLGGPIEATSHSYRLLGGIVNSMPYMQEWAYKNGVLGHAGGLVLNNPFVKTFAGMGKILFTDISSDEALETIQEMAKLGIIPEKTWQKTWSKEFAELTGAKKVGLWDFSPILYGKNSIDLKSRVLMYRLTKAMNPNATPEQIVTMQNELGNYTMSLQGELEKFVKKHGLAPFYSFGGAIYRSGMKSVFGANSLPLTRPSLKEAFTTKLGAEQMAKLATYKMAQLLSAGVVGLVAMWALTYHAQRDKWPWEEKSSKLLKIPFPKFAENSATRKMFTDSKGNYEDVDFSFFNPFINRGVRALGLPKFYETEQLGGTTGQAVEAGTVQAINTNLSPYTSSPAIQIGTTALTGAAPYITSIRDKYAGTPGIGLYRKVNTMPSGVQIPANVAVSAVGLNPIVDYAFSPLTKSLKYQYGEEDDAALSAAKSVFNTIIPHLFTPHGNDEGKAKILHNQAKAIKTSMEKESHKK